VGEVAALKLATLFLRPAQLFSDIAVSIRGGRGLKSRQRSFLLRDFRLELESAVEDAERHAISDDDANRISLLRSLIRWLENGELPGPDMNLSPRRSSRISTGPRNRNSKKSSAWPWLVGVKPGVLLKGAESGAGERPGREMGLNQDRPGGDDADVQP
jgi:hypothetical protein